MNRLNLTRFKKFYIRLSGLLLISLPGLVLAEEAPKLDSGDTAWMIVATVLVLFMTIPGLSLFYAGMVRSRMFCQCLCSVLR